MVGGRVGGRVDMMGLDSYGSMLASDSEGSPSASEQEADGPGEQARDSEQSRRQHDAGMMSAIPVRLRTVEQTLACDAKS